MSYIRRLHVVLTGLVLLQGCGSVGDLPDDGSDGGGGRMIDAGTSADSGPADPSPPRKPKPGTDALEADSTAIIACYDGIDNDTDGRFDCTDDSCAAMLASCCVGRPREGSCCETVPSRIGRIEAPASCTGEACLDASGLTTFGTPLPYASAGNIYPGGDGSGDSGAYSNVTFDLTTTRLQLVARLGPGDCAGSTVCGEAVGVAVTRQQELTEGSVVRPIAGVLVSGARRTVSLIVNGTIAWSAPVPETPDHEYTLELDPTGQVRLLGIDGAPAVSFVPEPGARLVVYGRNRNPATRRDGAYLSSLVVTEQICDIPTAWTDRDRLALSSSGAGYAGDVIRGPSVLAREGEAFLAFEHQGRIHVARELVDGWDVVADAALIGRSTAWDQRVRDPELVEESPRGRFVLFYTGVDSDGKTRIGRAESSEATPSNFVADPTPVLEIGDASVDAPAVIHDGASWQMIARIRHVDGRTELGSWSSADGRTWAPVGRSMLPAVTARDPRAVADAFDTHEIAAPALVRVHSTWQLYYAGRSGSRWGIGVLVSDDLVHWRAEGGGAPAFAPDASGFDGFGVVDPSLRADGTTLELFYAGTDGSRSQLGSTIRAVPSTVLGGGGG